MEPREYLAKDLVARERLASVCNSNVLRAAVQDAHLVVAPQHGAQVRCVADAPCRCRLMAAPHDVVDRPVVADLDAEADQDDFDEPLADDDVAVEVRQDVFPVNISLRRGDPPALGLCRQARRVHA